MHRGFKEQTANHGRLDRGKKRGTGRMQQIRLANFLYKMEVSSKTLSHPTSKIVNNQNKALST